MKEDKKEQILQSHEIRIEMLTSQLQNAIHKISEMLWKSCTTSLGPHIHDWIDDKREK